MCVWFNKVWEGFVKHVNLASIHPFREQGVEAAFTCCTHKKHFSYKLWHPPLYNCYLYLLTGLRPVVSCHTYCMYVICCGIIKAATVNLSQQRHICAGLPAESGQTVCNVLIRYREKCIPQQDFFTKDTLTCHRRESTGVNDGRIPFSYFCVLCWVTVKT